MLSRGSILGRFGVSSVVIEEREFVFVFVVVLLGKNLERGAENQ